MNNRLVLSLKFWSYNWFDLTFTYFRLFAPSWDIGRQQIYKCVYNIKTTHDTLHKQYPNWFYLPDHSCNQIESWVYRAYLILVVPVLCGIVYHYYDYSSRHYIGVDICWMMKVIKTSPKSFCTYLDNSSFPITLLPI